MNSNFHFQWRWLFGVLVLVILLIILVYFDFPNPLSQETKKQTVGGVGSSTVDSQSAKNDKGVINSNLKSSNHMAIEFGKVPLNSNEKNSCSPVEPSSPWLGLIIKAPSQVILERGSSNVRAIPVCGYYRIDLVRLLNNPPIRLVVVDVETEQEFSGDVIGQVEDRISEPIEGEPRLIAEEVKGMNISTYFNPNLLDYVDLPLKSATYDMYVEYGGYRSNVVQTEVIFEPT